MLPSECPHVDIDIYPENISTDFSKVLDLIRPKWRQSQVEYKQSAKEVSRGLINSMIKCFNKEYPAESVMIRIHNQGMNNLLNRSLEVTCIKFLKPFNCAPNILATFNNGFCYDYIYGTILSHHRLPEEPIWRLVAEELAKIHSVTIMDGEVLNGQPTYVQMLDMLIANYPDEFPDPALNHRVKTELPDKEILLKELAIAKAEVKYANSPVVLCHNDTRAENIIWQPHRGTVKFVDFEVINYNYQALEISNHFCRYAGFSPPDMSLIPSENFQLKWLNAYLRKYYKCKGFDPDTVTQADVRKLYVQVNKLFLFSLISSGLLGPVMASKSIVDIETDEIDFIVFAAEYTKEYFRRKKPTIQMKMPE